MSRTEFKLWNLTETQSVAPIFADCRRGIYVLHFENGERYVGKASDVVSRYTSHRHGSLHHTGWSDIVAIEFCEVPHGDLDALERETIKQNRAHFRLRNKAHNFGHGEPSPLDDFIPTPVQEHWATGHPSCNGTEFVLASKRTKGPTPKLLAKQRGLELLPDGRHVWEAVIDQLAWVVANVIPNAVETEGRFWSLSDYPETAGGRFATLNVGWLELAVFPRRRFESELGSLEHSNALMWFVNAAEGTLVAPAERVPHDAVEYVADHKGMPLYFAHEPDSYSVPVDRAMLPLNSRVVESAFPRELAGMRSLALHAMRSSSAKVNSRSYSAELTRLVYERIVRGAEESV